MTPSGVLSISARVPIYLASLFLLLALVGLEHLQHAVGDDVAADDVHRAQHGGQEDEHPGERTGGVRGDDDDARDDDAVDGVGARHQRGVQGGGHLADDLDADEQREDEQCDRNDDIHCFTPLPSWLPRRGRPRPWRCRALRSGRWRACRHARNAPARRPRCGSAGWMRWWTRRWPDTGRR